MNDLLELPMRKAITISQKVGCGWVYLIIELDNEKFAKLTIRGTMAKSCDCGESFLEVLGKILTFAIRRAVKEGDGVVELALLKHLKGHRCNKPIYKGALSCVDAIEKGIQKYMEVDNGKKETN